MRHDYNLPADWSSMTDEQKCRWMAQDRVLRQTLRQDTPTARHLHKLLERTHRKAEAQSGSVDLGSER